MSTSGSDSSSDDEYLDQLIDGNAGDVSGLREENPHLVLIQSFRDWFHAEIHGPDTLNIYAQYAEKFGDKRIEIFEAIRTGYRDTVLVDDLTLYAWKCLVYDLIRSNRRYKSHLEGVVYDQDAQTINMNLGVRGPHFFTKFTDPEDEENVTTIFVKDNGSDIYLG
mgnify:CR=1 FL=1